MNRLRLHFLKSFFLIIFLFANARSSHSQALVRIKHFGTHKGHLKMYAHIPSSIDKTKPVPMVVVLHGCFQCAGSVASQTGWNKLADEYGFYVLYPQQRATNNPAKCFKWYKRKHINKNRGENYSIKTMIGFMKSHYAIDSSKVYITGLSAGAAMGAIMMADYPETFQAGAIFAGAPYKVATSMIPAGMAFLGWRIKSPEKWGNLVRKQNFFYTGKYPKMIIYQGNNDWIVNKRNGVELMKQWTNVQGISTTPTETINEYVKNQDIQRSVFKKDNQDVVVFYKVNHLSHALLVDPGKCEDQGGRRGFFSKDKDFNSTLFTAYDFGLIETPVIIGANHVLAHQQNITYSIPESDAVTYQWSVPADFIIVSTNKNSITVNAGISNGCIDVCTIDAGGCKKRYQTLFVSVGDLK